MKFTVFLFTIFINCCGFSQVQTYYVKPISTNPNYASNEDSSTVSHDAGNQINKLFLFLGGTNSSSSENYIALKNRSVDLGFHFINLSYPNTVAAASLSNDSDSLVFNKYRQEICFGTNISPDVSVDSLNSIAQRVLNLLQYLNTTYPVDNWGQYLLNNSVDWTKILIGGHSQGSGHAAYIAKQFPVSRVLMFSGPNDYSDYYSNSANWLSEFGATPLQQHFCYLSLNDEIVDFSKQFANMDALGLLSLYDSTYVDDISSPYNNSHFLYTTQAPGFVILNHSVPIKLSVKNNRVWEYMLTTPITMDVVNFHQSKFSVYPNPAASVLTVNSILELKDYQYVIRNSVGQVISKSIFLDNFNKEINISILPPGIYFLSGGNNTVKFIKQ